MPKKGTKTTDFGVSKRESHDAQAFYNRSVYENSTAETFAQIAQPQPTDNPPRSGATGDQGWMDTIYCHTSENMQHIPDSRVALAFTSPPYNAGKQFDEDLSLTDYLELIRNVGREVFRVLVPGGRYVVNIANLGRKPYIPLHAYFYSIHANIGFLPAGEVIWQKGAGMSGSCAWGSWMSAKAPRLRDLHEYLLVFVKDEFGRPDKGESDISRDEFMEATLSIWNIHPESAKKVGHPAPFPLQLARRVVRLYSYVGDVVLDPFCGSGTTCLAAKEGKRHFVGYDVEPQYCRLAEERIGEGAKEQLTLDMS